MRSSFVFLALFCLNDHITQVSAKFHVRSLADTTNLLGHSAYLNTKVRRQADVALNHAAYVESRQNVPSMPASAASISSSAAVSAPTDTTSSAVASPDNSTDTACVNALSALNGVASSPSGMSICYNVLQFDNTTGDFTSSLELFEIGPATGDWVSVPQGSINVGINYPGAEVTQGSNMGKRNQMVSWPPIRRSAVLTERDAPMMVSEMSFIGQVDASMGSLTNM